MITVRTPYRLSFFGGGSDYPQWYSERGGAVLAAAIRKYVWLTVRDRTVFGPAYRLVYSRTESCNSLDEIQHHPARETFRHLKTAGAEVYCLSDLPARSGVGSSSAFVVGLVNALKCRDGLVPARQELAGTATHIERDLVGDTVGSQDQITCAHGGFNVIRFHPASGGRRPAPTLTAVGSHRNLEERLLLFYTGVARTASSVAASYVSGLGAKTGVIGRLVEMVDFAAGRLAARGDLDWFGGLLDEAWQLKKSLGPQVSSPVIDTIYDCARSAGALGGKLLGAGGGGFILFYVPPERQTAVRTALSGLKEVPVAFDYEGSRVVWQA